MSTHICSLHMSMHTSIPHVDPNSHPHAHPYAHLHTHAYTHVYTFLYTCLCPQHRGGRGHRLDERSHQRSALRFRPATITSRLGCLTITIPSGEYIEFSNAELRNGAVVTFGMPGGGWGMTVVFKRIKKIKRGERAPSA